MVQYSTCFEEVDDVLKRPQPPVSLHVIALEMDDTKWAASHGLQ